MSNALYRYLSEDHDRLGALLQRAVVNPGVIDMESYSEFRKGLLRHIAIEEKLALPAIARWQGGTKAAMAERLRKDHSAIVALLVPPPTPSIILTLQSILTPHNLLEEQDGGFYRLFDELAGAETDKILADLKAAPDVLVLPHNERPDILEITKNVVSKAGYEFKIA